MHPLVSQALAFQQQSRFEDAEQCLIERLRANHLDADAWHHRGVSAHVLGRNHDAVAFIERSLRLQPQNADAFYNLGVVSSALEDFEASTAAYGRALELRPEFHPARKNLSKVLFHQGALTEAIKHFEKAYPESQRTPDTEAWLAAMEKSAGWIHRSVDRFEKAYRVDPDNAVIHSQWLFAQQYDASVDCEELVRSHRRWGATNAPETPSNRFSTRQRSSNRAITIGFVSPDLSNHPVGRFLKPLVSRLDTRKIRTIAYSDHEQPDEINLALRESVSTYREVDNVSHDQLGELIRQDEVDILFDLAGHTDGNRLPVFARRAAPIQISWAGYVGTTGITAMDYLLCDSFHVPADPPWNGTEQPLRMPNNYVPFEPPPYASDVTEPPCLKTGRVTFGSMNNVCKVNDGVIELWSEILKELSSSRLLLKFKGFGDPGVQARVRSRFAMQGISAERIEFLGQSQHREHLACYDQIDIALDTFPYSGGITTCEAIWMGVPVITCPGRRFASRHAFSHLSNTGLGQFVSTDHQDYVMRAVELASDPQRLLELRRNLRDQVRQSPLCDLDRYAKDFTDLMFRIWHEALGED